MCQQDAAKAAGGEAGHTQACGQMCARASLPAIVHGDGGDGEGGRDTGLRVREAGRARELVCTCARGSLCAHSVCFSHGFISEDCFRAWSQVLSSSGNYAFLGGSGRELGV